jgi:DNA-binding MarR family transcriptional regulator
MPVRSTTSEEIALQLRTGIGLLLRRLRQAPAEGELSLPEGAALSRIERGGPATASALAKLEQISPQSMGATLAGLERRGLIRRDPDPEDGRKAILSLTDAGADALRSRRNSRTQLLAAALEAEFTAEEREKLQAAAPLLERLAQSI